jgi:hypothetical protein
VKTLIAQERVVAFITSTNSYCSGLTEILHGALSHSVSLSLCLSVSLSLCLSVSLSLCVYACVYVCL